MCVNKFVTVSVTVCLNVCGRVWMCVCGSWVCIMFVCLSVCVYVRERETDTHTHAALYYFLTLLYFAIMCICITEKLF